MSDIPVDPESAEEETTKQPLNLEVTVDSEGACVRHVTVTVPREDIERYFVEALDELAPKAEVPGFRPGRAPRKLVEGKFRKQLAEQVKGSLLMDSMSQVSDTQEFSAISEPQFDVNTISLPDEGPFSFEFNIEVRPEFELPNWKGLRLQRRVREFGEPDIDEHLGKVLSRFATVKPFDGPVEPGRVVDISLVFEHEGEEVSRITDQTVEVRAKLGLPDGEIEDFAQAIAGAVAGDIRRAKVAMSPNAEDPDLAGKTLDVEIEVVRVKNREYPPLSSDLLERLGGFKSVEELRERIRFELESQLAYHQDREVRDQITRLLTATANWELPEDLLRRQFARELERTVMEMQSSGFSDEAIQAQQSYIRRNSMAATSRALKEHFILERIAEDEKIDAEPEDYDSLIAAMAARNGESNRKVRARLEKRGQMDSLRNQVIERKVIQLITDHAQFTDAPFELQPNDTAVVSFAICGPVLDAIPEAKHGEAEPLRKHIDHS